jgi:hypothetical protein
MGKQSTSMSGSTSQLKTGLFKSPTTRPVTPIRFQELSTYHTSSMKSLTSQVATSSTQAFRWHYGTNNSITYSRSTFQASSTKHGMPTPPTVKSTG